MKTVSLTIDGKRVSAHEGDRLLRVALDNGIYIPNLCAIRERVEPLAACRLCFVEVAGKREPVTACTQEVVEGMVVNTRGEKALGLARSGFELLMATYIAGCATCPKNRRCEIQKIARHIGARLRTKRLRNIHRQFPIDESNPLFIYDPNRCVLCGRCVWVSEQHGCGNLGFARRGFDRLVTTFGDEPIGARCGSCGECAEVCPCGAMVFKRDKTPTAEKSA